MANGGKDTIVIDVTLKLNKDDVVKQAQDAARKAAKAFNDEFAKGTGGAPATPGSKGGGGAKGGGTAGGAGSVDLSAMKQILSSFVQSLKQLQTAITGAAAKIGTAAPAGTTTRVPGTAPPPPTSQKSQPSAAPGTAGQAGAAVFAEKVEALKARLVSEFDLSIKSAATLGRSLTSGIQGLAKALDEALIELSGKGRKAVGAYMAVVSQRPGGTAPAQTPKTTVASEGKVQAKTQDLSELANKTIRLVDESLESRAETFKEMISNLQAIRKGRGFGLGGKASTQIESSMKVIAELPTVMSRNLDKDISPIRAALKKAEKMSAGALKGGEGSAQDMLESLREVTRLAGKALPKSAGGAEQGRLRAAAEKASRLIALDMERGLQKQAEAARKEFRRVSDPKTGASTKEVESAFRNFENKMRNLQDFFQAVSASPFGDPHTLKTSRFGQTTLAPGAKALGAPELVAPYPEDVKRAVAALKDPSVADPMQRVREAMSRLGPDSKDFLKNMQTTVGAAKDLRSASTEEREQLKASTSILERNLKARQADVFRGTQKISIPRIEGELPAATYGRLNAAVDKLRGKIAASTTLGKGFRTEFSADLEFSSGATKKLIGSLVRLGSTASQVSTRYKELGAVMSTRSQFAQAFRRVAMWGTAAGITYGMISAFRQAFQTMKQVETGVTELVKVMREAEEDINKFKNTVVSFAKTTATEFGASIKSVLDVMSVFGRQGKTMAEVQDLTRASSLAANVTVLNQAQAAEALTATIHQFNLEASSSISIIDKWNEVANRNAVTEAILANAIKKTGAAAATVGVSHEQLIGLVTAIGTATRQSGQQIGTSLRFIFQRSLRPETGNTLKKLGVNVLDAAGNYRTFADVLSEVSAKWADFSKSQQLAIAQAFGGARQYNAFLVLLRNYDLAIKAANDAIGAHGSAQKENIRVMETTEKKLAQAKAEVDALVTSFGGSLLPVVKASTSVLKSFVNVLDSLPNTLKVAGVAALGLFAILSRYSYAIEAMMPAAAAGGAAAGGGLLAAMFAIPGRVLRNLVGAGKSMDVINAKYSGLTGTQKAFKNLNDHTRITNASMAQMATTAGVTGVAFGTSSLGMSKFQAAVKRVQVGSDKTVLGVGSMNSVLTMTALIGTRAGQGIAVGLTKGYLAVKTAAGGYKNLGDKASELSKKNALIKASTLGAVGSWALLGATIGGVYVAYKLLSYAYTEIFNKSKKTGAQVTKDLSEELAKRTAAYRVLRQQASAVEDLGRRRRKAESFRGASPERVRSAVADKSYVSPVLQDIRAAQAEAKSGDVFMLSSPGLIANIDEFGNAVLKSRDAMKDLTQAALESQSVMVAITRTKIAKAFGDDVQKAMKGLKNSLALLNTIRPAAATEAAMFGNVEAFKNVWKDLATDVLKNKDKIQVAINAVIRSMSNVPRDTPLESFADFLESGSISKALDYEARRMNSTFELIGARAITAGNILNRVFLQTRTGLKLIRSTGKLTEETFKEKLSTLPQEMEKYTREGGKGFQGGELIILPPGAPFGLDQVLVRLNKSGEAIGEAITKNGIKWRGRLKDLFRAFTEEEKLDVRIFDSRLLAQKARESILEAKRAIAGAGAGQIVFPTKLEFGVKFATDLGDVERLQRVLPKFIGAVYLAQQQYITQAAAIQATAKKDPSGQMDSARLKVLEGFRITAGFITLMASFVMEMEKISNSVAKAVTKLEDSNIASRVEAQFAPLFGTRGAIKGLQVPKLQTFRETSADAIVSGLGPEFAISASSNSKALEAVKEAIVLTTKLGSRDLDRMFKDFSATEVFRAKEVARGLKGDLGTGLVVTWLSKIYDLWKRSPLITGVSGTAEAGVGLATDLIASAKSAVRLFMAGVGEGEPSRFLGATSRGPSRVDQEYVDSMFKAFGFGATKSGAGSSKGMEKVYEVIADVISKSGERVSRKGVEHIAKVYREVIEKEIKSIDPSKLGRDVSFAAQRLPAEGSIFSQIIRTLTLRPAAFEKGAEAKRSAEKSIIRLKGTLDVLDDIEKLGGGIQRLNKIVKESVKFGPEGVKGSEADIKKYRASAKGLLESDKKRALAAKKALVAIARRRQVQESIDMVFKAVYNSVAAFSQALIVGVKDIRTNLKSEAILKSLQAPISGALKGVVVPQLDLGKSMGDLSPFERVAKSLPGVMRSISEMASLRTGALALFQKLAVATAKTDEVVKAGGEGVTPQLRNLQKREVELKASLRYAIEGVNRAMSPFVESLRKMTALETARKSIESLVLELRKLEELSFDTTSIDKALGRHPLSPTAGQFGQPAGLDKFQRQLFEITQKMRGPQTRQQYAQLQLEKKRVEFGQKEALIQYRQQKENAKLSSEVQAAQKAMSILFDAQTKGIEGTQPLINTLKSELASAGDISIGPSGKKFFQGIPSLRNLPKDLARIQESLRVKGLEQQKRIVMQPLIDLQGKANALLKEIRDSSKARSDEIEKGKKPGTAGEDALKKALSITSKAFQDAGTATSKALKKLADSSERAAANLDILAKKATGVAFEPRKGVPTVAPPLGAGGQLAPVQSKYSGGMVYGPAGIDNVPARLTAGEYVVPRAAANRIGKGALDRAVRGYQEGGIVNFLTPKEEEWLGQQWADQTKKDLPRTKAQRDALLLELGQFAWAGGTYSGVGGKGTAKDQERREKELEKYGFTKTNRDREAEILGRRAKIYAAQGKKVKITKEGLKVTEPGYKYGQHEFRTKKELEDFKTSRGRAAERETGQQRLKEMYEEQAAHRDFSRLFGVYGSSFPFPGADAFKGLKSGLTSGFHIPEVLTGKGFFRNKKSQLEGYSKKANEFSQNYRMGMHRAGEGNANKLLKQYTSFRDKVWPLQYDLDPKSAYWQQLNLGKFKFSDSDKEVLPRKALRGIHGVVRGLLDVTGGGLDKYKNPIHSEILGQAQKELGATTLKKPLASAMLEAAARSFVGMAVRPGELIEKARKMGVIKTAKEEALFLAKMPFVAGKGIADVLTGKYAPRQVAVGAAGVLGGVAGGLTSGLGSVAALRLGSVSVARGLRSVAKTARQIKLRNVLKSTYPEYKPTIPKPVRPTTKLDPAAFSGVRARAGKPAGFAEPPTHPWRQPGKLGTDVGKAPRKGIPRLIEQFKRSAAQQGYDPAKIRVSSLRRPLRGDRGVPTARELYAGRREAKRFARDRRRLVNESRKRPSAGTIDVDPLESFRRDLARMEPKVIKPIGMLGPKAQTLDLGPLGPRGTMGQHLGRTPPISRPPPPIAPRLGQTVGQRPTVLGRPLKEPRLPQVPAVPSLFEAPAPMPRYPTVAPTIARPTALTPSAKLRGRAELKVLEKEGLRLILDAEGRLAKKYPSGSSTRDMALRQLEAGVLGNELEIIDTVMAGASSIPKGYAAEVINKLRTQIEKIFKPNFGKIMKWHPPTEPGGSMRFGFASGGFIKGPGTGTSDSISTFLQPGSYVVKASSAKKLIPARVSVGEYVASPSQVKSMGGVSRMNYVNKYGKLPGFAAGGPVEEEEFQLPGTRVAGVSNINIDISGIESKLTSIVTSAFTKAAAAVKLDEPALAASIEAAFDYAGVSVKVSHEDLPTVKVDKTDLPESIKVDTTQLESVLTSIEQGLGQINTAGGSVGAAFRPDMEKVEGSLDVLRSELKGVKKEVVGLFIDLASQAASVVSKDDLSREISASENKNQVKMNELNTDLNVRFSDLEIDNKIAVAVDKKAAELDSKLAELKSTVNNSITIAHQALSKTETRPV